MSDFKGIGGFLAWAEDRIAKEHEQHLLMEKNLEKEEFLDHFRENREDMVDEVNFLRSKGYTIEQACNEVGISRTSYYQRNKKRKEAKT
jgi:ACT domain-containing protein